MSHKHHSCTCDHSNVKFCKPCNLVHCLDCNKEWKQTGFNYYPYYLGNTTTPIFTTGGTVGTSYLLSTNDNQLKDGHTLTATAGSTCGHKG